eukprot:6181717-Pleurochrysis_carterae.AAC.6
MEARETYSTIFLEIQGRRRREQEGWAQESNGSRLKTEQREAGDPLRADHDKKQESTKRGLLEEIRV